MLAPAEEHINVLGQEFGTIYNKLYTDFLFINYKWSEFENLFGKEENFKLMNRIAPFFFFILQNNLLDDVVISITRITDPKKSLGKSNLTVRHFPDLVDESIQGKISKMTTRIIDQSSFCRDRRNRRISHSDMDLAIGHPQTKPLELTSREKISELLKSLQELFNSIEKFYFNSEVYFKIDSFEGSSLLKTAQDGLKFEDIKFKFLDGKQIDWIDFVED